MTRALTFFLSICLLLLATDVLAISSAHAEAIANPVPKTVCQEQASAVSLHTVTHCTVYADASHIKAVKYMTSVCERQLLNHGARMQISCTNTVQYATGQAAEMPLSQNVSHTVSYQKLR